MRLRWRIVVAVIGVKVTHPQGRYHVRVPPSGAEDTRLAGEAGRLQGIEIVLAQGAVRRDQPVPVPKPGPLLRVAHAARWRTAA